MAENITSESKRVFIAYANDAPNWNGMPLVGGNVGGSKEERGNLTQLKRAGLITTDVDEGLTWISFTGKGKEFARSLGIAMNNPRARRKLSGKAQILSSRRETKRLIAELRRRELGNPRKAYHIKWRDMAIMERRKSPPGTPPHDFAWGQQNAHDWSVTDSKRNPRRKTRRNPKTSILPLAIIGIAAFLLLRKK